MPEDLDPPTEDLRCVAEITFQNRVSKLYDPVLREAKDLAEAFSNEGIASAGKYQRKVADEVFAKFESIEAILEEVYVDQLYVQDLSTGEQTRFFGEQWVRGKIAAIVDAEVVRAQRNTESLCSGFYGPFANSCEAFKARVSGEGATMQQRLGNALTARTLLAKRRARPVGAQEAYSRASVSGPVSLGGLPTAFISYSWDSEEHRRWVIALGTRLRENGVNVVLDRWHLALGADRTRFMEKAVGESDHVLLICTPKYKEKADGRSGGVGWEALIVTGELADDLTQTKFIPVLRRGSFRTTLPVWLKSRVGVDLSGDPYSEEQFEILLRALHGAAVAAPPLGPAPVFGSTGAASDAASTNAVKCVFSPRAQLLSKELSMRAFLVVQESNWSDQIELAVLAETSEIDALFSRFRGHKDPVVIAYGFDVAIARLVSLNRIASGGRATWKASFVPSRTEFSNDMEMGTSSTTADEFAEKRVRRLLLNENPMAFQSKEDDSLGLANEAMFENLVQGLNAAVKIEHSPFLDLYPVFGQDPQAFLEIAWIAAVTDLKLSAAIEHIHHLALGLVGDTMAVDFAGRRHRKYANVPPYEIKVQGTLRLSAASQGDRDSDKK
jgi:TIR domain